LRGGGGGGRLCLVLTLGQLAREKFDLIAEAGVAIEQDHFLSVHPAAPALGAIAGLAQKFLSAHLNISALGAEDEFLKTGFLLVLVSSHDA